MSATAFPGFEGLRLDTGETSIFVRRAGTGPAILLSGHLAGETPILIYRVADYRATIERLRAAGVADLHELEIPHGPCATFTAPGGQRLAVYELTRPQVAGHFDGRFDELD